MPAEIERLVNKGQTAGFISNMHLFQTQSNLSAAAAAAADTTVSIYFHSTKGLLQSILVKCCKPFFQSS